MGLLLSLLPAWQIQCPVQRVNLIHECTEKNRENVVFLIQFFGQFRLITWSPTTRMVVFFDHVMNRCRLLFPPAKADDPAQRAIWQQVRGIIRGAWVETSRQDQRVIREAGDQANNQSRDIVTML
jgi:hypothetical protein